MSKEYSHFKDNKSKRFAIIATVVITLSLLIYLAVSVIVYVIQAGKYEFYPSEHREIGPFSEVVSVERYSIGSNTIKVQEGTTVARRNSLVEKTELICDYFNLSDCIFCYIDGYFSQYNNGAFVSPTAPEWDMLVQTVIESRAGRGAHFGLTYAEAYFACKEMGLPVETVTVEKSNETGSDKSVYSVMHFMPLEDLSLPLFDEQLSNGETRAAARKLAVGFADWLGAKKTENLVYKSVNDKNSFEIEYRLYLSEYLGINVDYEPAGYNIYRSGKYLACENDTEIIYVEQSYRDGAILNDYIGLKNLLNDCDNAFGKIREFFGVEFFGKTALYLDPARLNELAAKLYGENANVGGITFDGNYAIVMSPLLLAHEYAHCAGYFGASAAENWNDSFYDWIAEALPSYLNAKYSELFVFKALQALKYDDGVYKGASKLAEAFPSADNMRLYDAIAYAVESYNPDAFYDWTYQNNRKLNEFVAISLVNYLVENYGKAKTLLYALSQADETEVFGKTFSELRSEWFKSLSETYSELTVD